MDLYSLNLAANRITFIAPDAFATLHLLRSLELGDNPLLCTAQSISPDVRFSCRCETGSDCCSINRTSHRCDGAVHSRPLLPLGPISTGPTVSYTFSSQSTGAPTTASASAVPPVGPTEAPTGRPSSIMELLILILASVAFLLITLFVVLRVRRCRQVKKLAEYARINECFEGNDEDGEDVELVDLA